jgi:hypothetical protein
LIRDGNAVILKSIFYSSFDGRFSAAGVFRACIARGAVFEKKGFSPQSLKVRKESQRSFYSCST